MRSRRLIFLYLFECYDIMLSAVMLIGSLVFSGGSVVFPASGLSGGRGG